MSTILKALKKLENEQESRQPSGTGAIPDFNTRQAVQRAVKLVRFKRLGLKMGIVAGALAAAGIVAYLYPWGASSSHPLASNPIHETVRPQEPARQHQPLNRGGRPSGIAKPRKTMFPRTDKADSMQPQKNSKPFPSLASESPAKLEPTPRMNNSAGQTDTHAKWNSPAASKTPPVSAKRTDVPADIPQTRPSQQVSKEVDRFEGAERLRDGRLKVQAIAWSPNVQERMAVINNRVIREGQTIDSFTIVAIGPDEVVAKEGPKTWKVAFGSP